MNGDQRSDVYVQEKQDFVQCFSQIVRVLTEDKMGHPETGDYNAIGGKYHWALTVLVAFRELMELRKQDAESLQRALTVGWCVELLQAFFLLADDITDSSLTICWLQKPGVGLDTISDAMEACIYCPLKLCCREQPYYVNLIQLFLQCFYQTETGQTLDLITAPHGNADLGRFTKKRYKSSVKYKAAYYSFYLPVAAAMYMAGTVGEKEHTNAKKILLEMGEGDVTGKVGTDKQDSKCSWLVVQCLQWATPEWYQILKENYRQRRRPRRLYEELDLPAEDSYSHIMSLTEQYAVPLPPVIFLGLTCNIYKWKSDLETERAGRGGPQ
uniref:Farnesyl pyrophosphate synthase n=1 Tax=Rhinopithecus roxellana TaxID=61622 RepID=A0A2K6QJJ5_RHIRO